MLACASAAGTGGSRKNPKPACPGRRTVQGKLLDAKRGDEFHLSSAPSHDGKPSFFLEETELFLFSQK
jgi:hypothetical protein